MCTPLRVAWISTGRAPCGRVEGIMDDRFDGFSVSLHQDSDGAWLACFEERPEISAFGNSPETALQQRRQRSAPPRPLGRTPDGTAAHSAPGFRFFLPVYC